MMKRILLSFVAAAFLSGCEYSVGSLSIVNTLDWSKEPAGELSVRGRDYEIEKATGRDKETGEVFVVEYRANVNGHRVTCVGDINNCVAAIENELDNPMDKDDY